MKYLKVCLAIIIFVSLFFVIDFKDLLLSIKNISFFEFIFLMFISFLLVWISALKWQLFLNFFGEIKSSWKLFNYYLIGYFINLISPSYVGGDIVRSIYASKSKAQGITATILERLTGLVAMVSLGLFFVSFTTIANELRIATYFISLFVFFGLIILFSDRCFTLFIKLPIISKFKTKFEQVKSSLNLAKRNKKLIIRSLLFSYLFHFITVVNVLTVSYAIGWFDIPVLELFVILPVVLLIGAIPITPSGLGLQEGAFFMTLTRIGATNEQAVAIAVVLRLKVYILAVCGGIFFLLEKNETKI